MPLPKFEGTDDFEFPDEKEQKASVKASDEEEDFKVEIEDDTPPQDRGRKPMAEPPEDPTDEELASYDEKVQNRIKKFTRGYHDERRAKEQAERERVAAEEFARKVFEENKRLKEQLESGSKVLIEQHQTSVQTELESAKRKVKEAFEGGDAEGMVAAQEELAKATMRLQRAQEMQPIRMQEEEFAPPRTEAPRLDAKTQRWVQSNSDWFGKDDEMTMAAMGLDRKLQREYGAEYIGTDDYFKRVDSIMRKRFPEYFGSRGDDDSPQNESEPAQEDSPPRRASKSAVVAPATRSTPPNRVKLKESQVALARKLGITPEQYAKQVALLGRSQ
jgi:hypothetical protein